MTDLRSINPMDGSTVGSVPTTPTDKIPGLVEKARLAQQSWQAIGLHEWAELLGMVAPRFNAEA